MRGLFLVQGDMANYYMRARYKTLISIHELSTKARSTFFVPARRLERYVGGWLPKKEMIRLI